MAKLLTRGQLARQTGCNAETIRYYERTGLLEEPARSPNGYRVYDARHVRALRFVMRAKALGFGNPRIREFLTLAGNRDRHTRAEVKALTEAQIREVSQKLRDLELLHRELSRIAQSCDGSDETAEACPILLSFFDD